MLCTLPRRLAGRPITCPLRPLVGLVHVNFPFGVSAPMWVGISVPCLPAAACVCVCMHACVCVCVSLCLSVCGRVWARICTGVDTCLPDCLCLGGRTVMVVLCPALYHAGRGAWRGRCVGGNSRQIAPDFMHDVSCKTGWWDSSCPCLWWHSEIGKCRAYFAGCCFTSQGGRNELGLDVAAGVSWQNGDGVRVSFVLDEGMFKLSS